MLDKPRKAGLLVSLRKSVFVGQLVECLGVDVDFAEGGVRSPPHKMHCFSKELGFQIQ